MKIVANDFSVVSAHLNSVSLTRLGECLKKIMLVTLQSNPEKFGRWRDTEKKMNGEKKINYLLAPLEIDTVPFVCQLNFSPSTPMCRTRAHFSVCISTR